MVAPDELVTSEKVYALLLPPLAVNCTMACGAAEAVGGLRATRSPTTMLTWPVLPSESVAVTTSMVSLVSPAT